MNVCYKKEWDKGLDPKMQIKKKKLKKLKKWCILNFVVPFQASGSLTA